MIFLEIILFFLVFCFAILTFMLVFEIISAILQAGHSKKSEVKTIEHIKVAILMPAHDEEAVIEDSIKNILPQLKPEDRLLVIADNCSDRTVELARDSGAEVVEREDKTLKGKGFALDFGVQQLKADPPEIVIIIDADCLIEASAIEQLASCAINTNRPVQALYLMESPENPSITQKIAAFAFFVKNYVRPLGLKKLGLPCHLMGTGMAFPWALICSADLANGNIVEDMKLGVDFICLGQAPVYLPEVKVTGVFPKGAEASHGQRTRWEHGHIDTIISQSPRLLYQGLSKLDFKLMLSAIDLAIFPLALLTMLLCLNFILSGLLVLIGVNDMIFKMMGFVLLIYVFGVLLAWFRFGREFLTATQLLSIPFYILRKITVYLSFLTNKQKKWVKTERD